MTVSRDATSLRYVPANSAEWTELLAGSGITNPSLLWLCQEASGNLADSIGSSSGVKTGSPTYQIAAPGWSRSAVVCRDGTNDLFKGAIADASSLAFAYLSFPSGVPATQRSCLTLGAVYGHQVAIDCALSTNPTKIDLAYTNDIFVHGTQSVASAVHPALVQANRTTGIAAVQTDLETLTHAFTGADALTRLALGGDNVDYWLSGGVGYLYVAEWTGAAAEIDAAHRATLLSRLQNGPPASSGYSRGRSVNDGRMNAFSRGKVVN